MTQSTTTRDRILEHAWRNPRATHAEIAEEVGTGRTYVTEVVGSVPDVAEVSDAYRGQIDVDLGSQRRRDALADLIRRDYPTVAKRLRDATDDDEQSEPDAVSIEFRFEIETETEN